YLPASSDTCEGKLHGAGAIAFSKSTPSCARRSRLGLVWRAYPYAETWSARSVSTTTLRTLGAPAAAAGNRSSSRRSSHALLQWIAANATSNTPTSAGRVRRQKRRTLISFRAAQRVKTEASPTANRKQLQCRSRPMQVNQSYVVRNAKHNTFVATDGIFGKTLATAAIPHATIPKSRTSTSGEIQMIGADTCSIRPQSCQFNR